MHRSRELLQKLSHPIDEIRHRTIKNVHFKLSNRLMDAKEIAFDLHCISSMLKELKKSPPVDDDVPKLIVSILSHVARAGEAALESLLSLNAVQVIQDFIDESSASSAHPVHLSWVDSPAMLLQTLLSHNVKTKGIVAVIPDMPATHIHRLESAKERIPVRVAFSDMSMIDEPRRNMVRDMPSYEFSSTRRATVSMGIPRDSISFRSSGKASPDDCGLKTEFLGWHFPPVQLTRDDEQLIFEFNIQFKLRDVETLKRGCRSFKELVVHDFPAELFLQRPDVLKHLLAVQASPQIAESSVADDALQALASFSERLAASFRLHCDPEIKCPNRRSDAAPSSTRALSIVISSDAYKLTSFQYPPNSATSPFEAANAGSYSFVGTMQLMFTSLLLSLKETDRISSILAFLRNLLPYLLEPVAFDAMETIHGKSEAVTKRSLDSLRCAEYLRSLTEALRFHDDGITCLLHGATANAVKDTKQGVAMLHLVLFSSELLDTAHVLLEAERDSTALPPYLATLIKRLCYSPALHSSAPLVWNRFRPWLLLTDKSSFKQLQHLESLIEILKDVPHSLPEALEKSSVYTISTAYTDEIGLAFTSCLEYLSSLLEVMLYEPALVTRIVSPLLQRLGYLVGWSVSGHDDSVAATNQSACILDKYLKILLRCLAFPIPQVRVQSYNLFAEALCGEVVDGGEAWPRECSTPDFMSRLIEAVAMNIEVFNIILTSGFSDPHTSASASAIVERIGEHCAGDARRLSMLIHFYPWLQLYAHAASDTPVSGVDASSRAIGGLIPALLEIISGSLSESDAMLSLAMDAFHRVAWVRSAAAKSLWEITSSSMAIKAESFSCCDPVAGIPLAEVIRQALNGGLDSHVVMQPSMRGAIASAFDEGNISDLIHLVSSPRTMDIGILQSATAQLLMALLTSGKRFSVDMRAIYALLDALCHRLTLNATKPSEGTSEAEILVWGSRQESPTHIASTLNLIHIILSLYPEIGRFFSEDPSRLRLVLVNLYHTTAEVRLAAAAVTARLCFDISRLRASTCRAKIDLNAEECQGLPTGQADSLALVIPSPFNSSYNVLPGDTREATSAAVCLIHIEGAYGKRAQWVLSPDPVPELQSFLDFQKTRNNSKDTSTEVILQLWSTVLHPADAVASMLLAVEHSSSHVSASRALRALYDAASSSESFRNSLVQMNWMHALRNFIEVAPTSEADDGVLIEVLRLLTYLVTYCENKDLLLVLLLTRDNLVKILKLPDHAVDSGDIGLHVREMLMGPGYGPHVGGGVIGDAVPRRSLRLAILTLIKHLLLMDPASSTGMRSGESTFTLVTETDLVDILISGYIAGRCVSDVALRREAIKVAVVMTSRKDIRRSCLASVGEKCCVFIPAMLSVIQRHRVPDSFAGKALLRCAVIGLRNLLTFANVTTNSRTPLLSQLIRDPDGSMHDPSSPIVGTQLPWLKSLLTDRESSIRASAWGICAASLTVFSPAYRKDVVSDALRAAGDVNEAPAIRAAALDVFSGCMVATMDDGAGSEHVGLPAALRDAEAFDYEAFIESGLPGLLKDAASSPVLSAAVAVFCHNVSALHGVRARKLLYAQDVWPSIEALIAGSRPTSRYQESVASAYRLDPSLQIFQESSLKLMSKFMQQCVSGLWSTIAKLSVQVAAKYFLSAVALCLEHDSHGVVYFGKNLKLGLHLLHVLCSTEPSSAALPEICGVLNNLVAPPGPSGYRSTLAVTADTSFSLPPPEDASCVGITPIQVTKVLACHLSFEDQSPHGLRCKLAAARCLSTLLAHPIASRWLVTEHEVDHCGHSTALTELNTSLFNLFKLVMTERSGKAKFYATADSLDSVLEDEVSRMHARQMVGDCLASLLQNSTDSKEVFMSEGGFRYLLDQIQSAKADMILAASEEATVAAGSRIESSSAVSCLCIMLGIVRSLLLHSKTAQDAAITSRLAQVLQSIWDISSTLPSVLKQVLAVAMNFVAENPESCVSLLFTVVSPNRVGDLGRSGKSMIHSFVAVILDDPAASGIKSAAKSRAPPLYGVLGPLGIRCDALHVLQSVSTHPTLRGVLCKIDFYQRVTDALQLVVMSKKPSPGSPLLIDNILNCLANAAFFQDASITIFKCKYLLEILADLLNNPHTTSISISAACLLLRNLAFKREHKVAILSTPTLVDSLLRAVSTSATAESQCYAVSAVWVLLYNYQKAIVTMKKNSTMISVLATALNDVEMQIRTKELATRPASVGSRDSITASSSRAEFYGSMRSKLNYEVPALNPVTDPLGTDMQLLQGTAEALEATLALLHNENPSMTVADTETEKENHAAKSNTVGAVSSLASSTVTAGGAETVLLEEYGSHAVAPPSARHAKDSLQAGRKKNKTKWITGRINYGGGKM